MGVGRGGEGIAVADLGFEDPVTQRREYAAGDLVQKFRRTLTPRRYRRLLKALAVVYGIEPMIILKDICGGPIARRRRWWDDGRAGGRGAAGRQ